MPVALPRPDITFSYQSSTDGWEDAFVLPVAEYTRASFELSITARQGSEGASFGRRLMFFRDAGASQSQRPWHTIFTDRSLPGFDISYVLGPDNVTIRVKAANNIQTLWDGSLKLQSVS